jgi:hypothetical protein
MAFVYCLDFSLNKYWEYMTNLGESGYAYILSTDLDLFYHPLLYTDARHE